MAMDRLHRSTLDRDPELDVGSSSIAPGRMPITARLRGGGGGHTTIFRVESAEAARELAGIFGPRDGNGVAANAEAAVERAASSGGAPLPGDLRERFESSLGADLSAVRLHTGDASADAASAVGARAFAIGNDVHFGAGTYDPTSAAGQFLIAHEVAHTVQQAGQAPSRQHKLEVSTPGDRAEAEADRAATAMVAGQPASVTTSAPAIARAEPAKATVEKNVVEAGPFKLNVSSSIDADGNGEATITASGSVPIPPKPAPIGATPLFWQAEVGAEITGGGAFKKNEPPEYKLESKFSGSAKILGGIPDIAEAGGGGQLSIAAPAVTISKKSGSWKPTFGGPLKLTLTPFVYVESKVIKTKYQVDLASFALAEITVSPFGVAPGADLVAIGNKIKSVFDKVKKFTSLFSNDQPVLKSVAGASLKKLEELIAKKQREEAIKKGIEEARASEKERKERAKAHGYDEDRGVCEEPMFPPEESVDPEHVQPRVEQTDCDPENQSCPVQ